MRWRTVAVAGTALLGATLPLAGALPLGGTSAGAAGAAEARVTSLAAPTGTRLAGLTGSSLTVSAHAVAGATGYRLFASTRRRDLYARNIGRAAASPVRRRPRATVSGLAFRTAPYYYRFAARRGSRLRLEASIHTAYLRPAAPRSVRAAGSVPSLTWRAGANTGYLVEQASNRAMTAGRRTYALRALTPRFTPYGLTAGHAYWFRVIARNGPTRSAPSTTIKTRVRGRQQPVRVMTYNVLEANTAGQRESGRPLASWSNRRAGVVALIRSRHPDVLAVQEAAAWIGAPQGYGGTRQVDDLVRALGPGYALAATETPPWVHYFRRAGDYLIYRRAAWTALPTAGHWDLGDGRWAAYQVLQSRTNRARVLAVSTHLAAGAGARYDQVRQRQTQRLLRDAAAVAGPAHLPVVYAGDFNSDVNRNHAFDGPGRAMRAAGVVDAEKVAQLQVNGRYDSANLNLPVPPQVDQSIDYVYAGPGVAVRSREVALDLVHGRFPGIIPSDHNAVVALAYVPY